MKRSHILILSGFLLVVLPLIQAEGGQMPSQPSAKDIRTSNTQQNTQLNSGAVEKGLKTKVEVPASPTIELVIPRDPLSELTQAVRKIIDGEDKSCANIRGVLGQIDKALFDCGLAINEDTVGKEKAEEAALRCDSYGGEGQLWAFKLDVLKVACGMDCFSESERVYYQCNGL